VTLVERASDELDREQGAFEGQRAAQVLHRVDSRYGSLDLPDAPDNLIVRFLTDVGEWAWDESSFLAGLLEDGARVLDGGAFLGTFGLGLAAQRRLSLLCAVEANASLQLVLKANLSRNTTTATVVAGAILSGSVPALRSGYGVPGNLGSVSFAEGATGDLRVPPPARSISLEELRQRHGDFDLIKLDIEGMELEVLLGDAAYLSTGRSMLWIECNESPKSLQVAELVLSWGLEVHYFAFPSHNPDNLKGVAQPILPWAYEAGLLVAPRSRPMLSEELAAHGAILQPIRSRRDLEDAMWFTPRWLPPELAHADAPRLAAAASRALCGQARDTFLCDRDVATTQTIWDRLSATEAALARAEELVKAHQAVIETETSRRADAEAALAGTRVTLADAEYQAVNRRVSLERETRLRLGAEASLAEAASQALARLEDLGREREELARALQRADEAAARVDRVQTSLAAAADRASVAEQRAEEATAQLTQSNTNAQYLLGELVATRATLAWRMHVFVEKQTRGLNRRIRALRDRRR